MVVSKEEIRTLLNKLQNDPNNRFDFDYLSEKNKNPFEWKTVLEGSTGSIYENGYYMVKIVFNENYPTSCPAVFFLNKIFHPHIHSSGSACIHPEKYDILSVMECVENMFFYYDADLSSAYGEEPRKTLESNRDEFIKKAQEWVRQYAKLEDLDKFYDL
jgi:ubiquitin-conjugating enzyme E2 S